ncbi:hypothetical protein R1sor_009299 [Riccia sorocarpa]|uniref:WRKY19-like zinc finger domain-containing protein n=1 Tax=Riccia sorocarpa TaxID=122646 RepID=A0ABD3HUQ3_9MARC
MIGGGVFSEENMIRSASREFLSLRREHGGDSDIAFNSRAVSNMAARASPAQYALSKFTDADSVYMYASGDNSPITTLSIGGDSVLPAMGGSRSVEDPQTRETLLQLKSWSVSADQTQVQVSRDRNCSSGGGEEYMSHDSSSKGVKRKRLGEENAEDDHVESGIKLCWGSLYKERTTGAVAESSAKQTQQQQQQLPHINPDRGEAINSDMLLGLRQQHDNFSGSSEDYCYQQFGSSASFQEQGTLLRLGQTGHREPDISNQLRFSPLKISPTAPVTDDVLLALGPSGGGTSFNSDQDQTRFETTSDGIPVVDEGSSSARMSKTRGGFMPALLMGSPVCITPPSVSQRAPPPEIPNFQNDPRVSGERQQMQELSMNIRSSTSGGTSSTSGASGVSERTSKICKFRGCSKGARGASGLCIAHGGGRRCEKQGCNKGAEGRTVYCKAHGGGRRCQNLGCTKSAEGKTDYCIGHGGGRRCSHDGCDKAARGRSGLCIRHGGGKRCMHENCTKSAEGYSGLCISHGGGRRCHYPECTKGAQGSTMFCKAHGGGKRCMIQGCNKGAEGSTPLCKGHGGGKRCMYDGGGICTKSVHGGTLYCVAHGGGKRCQVQGCSKSARGRTDFCVRHGGGKRCKVENCGKSAQGSTDFCKAHGGGKRCQWGVEGSGFGEPGKELCDKFARGKTGLCAAHTAQVADRDRRVHGGSGIGPGLTPGLFRGLVTSSSLNRCSSMGSGSSSSINVMCNNSREERTVHGSRTCSGFNFSGGAASSGSNTSSVTNVCSSNGASCMSVSLPAVGSNEMNHQLLHNQPGPPTSCDNNNRNLVNSSVSPAPSYGQSALIPPQVLVPLSMQKKAGSASFQSRQMHGRPPRPPVHHMSDEGAAFSMGSHSLPEGRVYGGSIPEGRVRGGALSGTGGGGPGVPEGRVHGGGLMALLSRGGTGGLGLGMESVSLGRGASESVDVRWGGTSDTESDPLVTTKEGHSSSMPEVRVTGGSSLGSDVGQFLATRMNMNFSLKAFIDSDLHESGFLASIVLPVDSFLLCLFRTTHIRR